MIRLEANAKINLGLDVLRKRPDGYHEVKMIMQSITLHDELELEESAESGIHLTCDRVTVPTDETNLICKAAALLLQEREIDRGVNIHLTKRIPMAAGIAGGSTDAAAAMKGINELFQLGFSLEELKERAVRIGADVPYCLMGGTALSEGIGEILTPLPEIPDCHILIARPDLEVSTAFVYGNLKVAELTEHPDIDGMIKSLEGQSLEGIAARLGNVLETVTVQAHPIISKLKEEMVRSGAMGALMSGSGPTVFGIFNTLEQAESAYHKMLEGRSAGTVCLTRPAQNRS
ncbi:MAG: 4-(cytidine 5'-diphospho)-2-C-methyl-D-erythritol kinase [Lachnospiraceae bacterium]|nr:4-(cytidine 5'-diphospho)-2-C-methyl-D-erythritol kinase [Lachnospiraceae bacterium]